MKLNWFELNLGNSTTGDAMSPITASVLIVIFIAVRASGGPATYRCYSCASTSTSFTGTSDGQSCASPNSDTPICTGAVCTKTIGFASELELIAPLYEMFVIRSLVTSAIGGCFGFARNVAVGENEDHTVKLYKRWLQEKNKTVNKSKLWLISSLAMRNLLWLFIIKKLEKKLKYWINDVNTF